MIVFGQTTDGRDVHALTLSAGDLTVRLLNWGAVLHSVRLAGVDYDLTLGSDDVTDYEDRLSYHGSLIGPVVNRLTRAQAEIAGQTYHFEANLNGTHSLHCGACGTHLKLWEIVDHGPAHATFAVDLPDGEGGYPGNRRVTARFEVEAPATLRMTIDGVTDAPSIMNFANHGYWNLDGSATWEGHSLKIAADRVLPTDDLFIPTGEIRDVTGTPYDLRDGRVLALDEPPIDNCFVLSDDVMPLREVLWLTGASGVRLAMATDAQGMHVFDGRHDYSPNFGRYRALAFEAENWPDAPNHAGFPSIEIGPDAPYHQLTEWRFSKP